MSAPGYSAIGGIFEYLNSDCDYTTWSQYLIEELRTLGAGRCGADVGCGNGYFTRALSKAGYEMVGIDISPQALNTAVELARKQGVSAEFLMGDITKLKLNGKVDFITAVNDCINYVPQQKLVSTFGRVYGNLKKGGVFIFDVSSARKLRQTVGNNTFVKDLDNATVVWCNTLGQDSVKMEITLFTRNKDGLYRRADETQIQYIHEEEAILSALEQVGFSARSQGHILGGKAERINFLCKKS